MLPLLLTALLALAAPALGQDRTRVDLYDATGRRTGYAIVQDGRVDVYDAQSRRTGWGTVSPSGGVTVYGRDGRRQTVAPRPSGPAGGRR